MDTDKIWLSGNAKISRTCTQICNIFWVIKFVNSGRIPSSPCPPEYMLSLYYILLQSWRSNNDTGALSLYHPNPPLSNLFDLTQSLSRYYVTLSTATIIIFTIPGGVMMSFYKNLTYPFIVLVYNNIYSTMIHNVDDIDTGLETVLIWYTRLPILRTNIR